MFFKFLGSGGLPGAPEEAQEGSQEAPKVLQMIEKIAPKKYKKQKQFLGPKMGPKIVKNLGGSLRM